VRLSIAPKGLPSRSDGMRFLKRTGTHFESFSKSRNSAFSLTEKQVFETEDQTFANAGKTGLWTRYFQKIGNDYSRGI
jgi:hypothetical protein